MLATSNVLPDLCDSASWNDCRPRAKMALSMVGMMAPTVFVRREASARPPKFRRVAERLDRLHDAFRVAGITWFGEFRQRETVAVDTPAARATSSSVGLTVSLINAPGGSS
jgi:hypothetical protein